MLKSQVVIRPTARAATISAAGATVSTGMTSPGVSGEAESEQDEVLIRALLERGDEKAFRTLYRRHTPRLFQMVIRIIGSVDESEDVVQETWIRAVDSLAAFRGEARFYSWIAAIAANRIGDRLRRRKRWVFDGVDLDTLPATDQQSTEKGVAAIDIERAVARLPQGSRTVLVLHDIEGFTHEEIAVQLGITAGTSKSQLFRARRALRKMFEQVEEGTDATAR